MAAYLYQFTYKNDFEINTIITQNPHTKKQIKYRFYLLEKMGTKILNFNKIKINKFDKIPIKKIDYFIDLCKKYGKKSKEV